MPKFDVDIPHALPPEDVKARLSGATAKIESKYGAACKWVSDKQLSVSRKGLDATVTIEATRVHIELGLGLLLSAMAPAIKAGLVKELTGLLTAGNGSAA